MTRPVQPCECIPYENICCCGPQNGISVIQPKCQTIPDCGIVTNPAFCPDTNHSYWSYKFIVDCDDNTRAISNFLIPICESISPDLVVVAEKVDGCGEYREVPFELIKDDPNFGPAPQGFQFLKVETSDRFEKGVSVEYRIELVGDYPISTQPIKVKAGKDKLSFECEGCFEVPLCNPEAKLTMTKSCREIIDGSKVTLDYTILVSNIGNGVAEDVGYIDKIIVPTQLTVGGITITPTTLSVDTSVAGQVNITGNLGTIEPGGKVLVTYSVPIVRISAPAQYTVSNTARAYAEGAEAISSCSANLNVSQVAVNKCCQINEGGNAVYKLTFLSIGDSPDILVDVFDNFVIPGGVAVKFTSFGGCIATYANTEEIVPLNTNLVGPLRIRIECNQFLVPQGGSIQKFIEFVVTGSAIIGNATITNAIESVVPSDPDAQIFLGAGTLPVTANINVQLNLLCDNPC